MIHVVCLDHFTYFVKLHVHALVSISITWTLLILLAQAIFKMYSSIGLEFSWLHELFFFQGCDNK